SGLADEGALLRKSGMQPGQTLILTKAIGTGALFAAAMRGKARGRWIDLALAAMQVSQQAAGDILRAHGATAMTDVTGFGLLGHLAEMARASAVDAVIDPASVPVLPGARDCIAAGIVSSLQPENLRQARVVAGDRTGREDDMALLVDPQTAGGLLAALPADSAVAAISALREGGYVDAAAIGRVIRRDGLDARIRLES
ncbi:MAG: selenide, water dikinase SelD, partial [Alphaproteobacteria bacterium]|nr:selenide, water dikinase SelD [Alphaproteobacteria bacterium]